MRKLTYALALSTFLLAGCSQDEGIMENKGELVTLNYNVSLGSGVQSRADESDLAVNKLLCAVYEVSTDGTSKEEVKRDFVSITNGSATYSPQLFSNVNYKIVFWAYYEDADATDESKKTCFNLENMEAITIISDNYDKGSFEENKYKDAYTGTHEISLTVNKQTPSITLTRPFGMVKVLTSKEDFDAAKALGSTPATGSLNIGSCSKTFDAYKQNWIDDSEGIVQLETTVSTTTVTYNEKECYVLANEYVFANGTVTTTNVQVKDSNSKTIYNSTIPNMPLGVNMRTNLYNEALLTGGGVTYTITIQEGFSDTDEEQEI